MATTVSSGFDVYLTRLKPTSSEVSSASRHRESVEAALQDLSLSRFFQTGSFSHGTGIRYHSDVDYLASFKSERPSSSDTALSRVKGRLQDRYQSTTVKI